MILLNALSSNTVHVVFTVQSWWMSHGAGSTVGNYHDWQTGHRQYTRSLRPVSSLTATQHILSESLINTCCLQINFHFDLLRAAEWQE